MKKFLYITDREEYTEHNFIGPLFEKYLPEYMDVDIVYFSKYKSFFEDRGGKFIVPEHEKKDILKYLSQNNIKVFEYDYVVVRNMHDILDKIIEYRDIYKIKVGFRLTFPKITASLERARAENNSSLLKLIDTKLKLFSREKLINRCDIFLPTSKSMQEIYCPNVTTKIHVIPSAIDPQRVHSKVKRDDETIIFTYEGTLTKLRRFDVVLEAFDNLNCTDWELHIFTKDVDFANSEVDKFSNLKDKIKIYNSYTKDKILDEISRSDVGLSLLPDLNIFNTSLPLKVIDYYTGAIPTLMSDNRINSSVFEHGKDAWLCDFKVDTIKKELDNILKTPKDKIREMGQAGQQKLLEKRNYRDVAKNFAEVMNSL